MYKQKQIKGFEYKIKKDKKGDQLVALSLNGKQFAVLLASNYDINTEAFLRYIYCVADVYIRYKLSI